MVGPKRTTSSQWVQKLVVMFTGSSLWCNLCSSRRAGPIWTEWPGPRTGTVKAPEAGDDEPCIAASLHRYCAITYAARLARCWHDADATRAIRECHQTPEGRGSPQSDFRKAAKPLFCCCSFPGFSKRGAGKLSRVLFPGWAGGAPRGAAGKEGAGKPGRAGSPQGAGGSPATGRGPAGDWTRLMEIKSPAVRVASTESAICPGSADGPVSGSRWGGVRAAPGGALGYAHM
jgi:hypothetical protein